MNNSNNDIIPVFMAFNEAYVQHACVTIASILANSDAKISFYVLHSDITSESEEKIACLRKLRDFGIEFIAISR